MKVVRVGAFSTNDLRDLLLDKSADTSRLVDRLVAKGLVSKEPCTVDSRRVNLKLTNEGIQVLTDIDEKMGELDAIFGDLPETEARKLNLWLDRLGGA
jgi:DNA-binding MarR family transcriptional regulator